jgi:small-conductance mechanosensitive channel
LCMFVCFRTVHCVCLFVFVLCIVYVFLSSHCALCMTQYTVRRQTNIHNRQYEEKQIYITHSTKTNKHTQYTVRRQYYVLCLFVSLRTLYCVCLFVFVLCIVYVCLSSYCVLCMFVCLRTVFCVCLFVFVMCIVYVYKHTQYTARRQTNIHNTQYEDKKTYTIHSTKTNKHTQYTMFVCLRTVCCLCLFVFVLCVMYVCLSSFCALCMFVCLRTVYCVCFLVFVLCIVYIWRKTNIHNTQYEDKQTYTIHSTKTNKHTQ